MIFAGSMILGHPLEACKALLEICNYVSRCVRELDGNKHNIQLFDLKTTA
jgi:hypothetical protein